MTAAANEARRVARIETNASGTTSLCASSGSFLFADGVTGLALIDVVAPDVAILDIGLPVMDGYEVARKLRDDPKHADMWLIALSGYGRSSDRDASRSAGFDEHLVKPVQVDQILGHLARSHAQSA